jgi:hypothetical protein
MKAARPEPFDYAQESLVEGFVRATGWSPLVILSFPCSGVGMQYLTLQRRVEPN